MLLYNVVATDLVQPIGAWSDLKLKSTTMSSLPVVLFIISMAHTIYMLNFYQNTLPDTQSKKNRKPERSKRFKHVFSPLNNVSSFTQA